MTRSGDVHGARDAAVVLDMATGRNRQAVRLHRDAVFDRPTQINADWDGIWSAEAVIDDEGRTAELAIPFKTLNFDHDSFKARR